MMGVGWELWELWELWKWILGVMNKGMTGRIGNVDNFMLTGGLLRVEKLSYMGFFLYLCIVKIIDNGRREYGWRFQLYRQQHTSIGRS